jgi:hypothetical protein
MPTTRPNTGHGTFFVRNFQMQLWSVKTSGGSCCFQASNSECLPCCSGARLCCSFWILALPCGRRPWYDLRNVSYVTNGLLSYGALIPGSVSIGSCSALTATTAITFVISVPIPTLLLSLRGWSPTCVSTKVFIVSKRRSATSTVQISSPVALRVTLSSTVVVCNARVQEVDLRF